MNDRYTVEFFVDSAGEHRWRFRHVNGNIVATSGEGYKNEGDCKTALANLIRAIITDGDAVPGTGDERILGFDWPNHNG